MESRIRQHQTIKAADPVDRGIRIKSECSIEIEAEERAALVAQTFVLIYEVGSDP